MNDNELPPNPPPSARLFPTPFRLASITPIETRYRHALHTYQGLCPWSPDGLLLYAGFEEDGGMADLVARDFSTGQDIPLATSRAYDFHTAAWQQWILHGSAIAYNDFAGESKQCLVRSRPDRTAGARAYPGFHLRAVSASTLRGYGTQLDAQGAEIAAARVDFERGAIETFFTAEDAGTQLPPELAGSAGLHINHFVPNTDETLAFFKLCKPAPHHKIAGQMDDWGAFFVVDLRSGAFRCLGNRVSGHPHWMKNGRHIVNVMQPLDGSDNRWLVTQDAMTGELHRLVDFPIEGPGHPALSPCGRYLATDAYTKTREICPVYLIDLTSGQMSEIARFAHSTRITDTYQPHTIMRANLHPVWSPDGRQLLVNVNDSGQKLGMVLLSDFLA